MKYLYKYNWNNIVGGFDHQHWINQLSYKIIIQSLKESKRLEPQQTVTHMIVNSIIYSRLHLNK